LVTSHSPLIPMMLVVVKGQGQKRGCPETGSEIGDSGNQTIIGRKQDLHQLFFTGQPALSRLGAQFE
jgi:hypothetical protein